MKFTSIAIVGSLFATGLVEAGRRHQGGRFRDTNYEKAVCAVNVAVNTDEVLPRGWTTIQQTEGMDAQIASYWGSLPAGGTYALYLIDDDGTEGQCDGTQLK